MATIMNSKTSDNVMINSSVGEGSSTELMPTHDIAVPLLSASR